MDDKPEIMGMKDLLAEVDRDLDDFRRKHEKDYSVKGVTLWWELEKDRLLVRHKDARVARRHLSSRRAWVFAAGCLAAFVLGALTTLVR